MNWPTAFALVGVAASIAAVVITLIRAEYALHIKFRDRRRP